MASALKQKSTCFSDIIRKTKKDFEKVLMKDIKIFQKEKKTKSKNMVVNDTKNFLKEKKVKGISMYVHAMKTTLKMRNKGYLNTKK